MVLCYFLVDKQLNISKDTIIALVLAKAPGVAAEFKLLRCLIFQVNGANERKWFLSLIHKTLLENTTSESFQQLLVMEEPLYLKQSFCVVYCKYYVFYLVIKTFWDTWTKNVQSDLVCILHTTAMCTSNALQ